MCCERCEAPVSFGIDAITIDATLYGVYELLVGFPTHISAQAMGGSIVKRLDAASAPKEK
jgi:hypothetical protein